MKKRVLAILDDHHPPAYEVYGALEAMLKKFGSLYSGNVSPKNGGYLWFWKLCDVNGIPHKEQTKILFEIQQNLIRNSIPINELNIIVNFLSTKIETKRT